MSANLREDGKLGSASEIAIVGMDARLPGASNIESFWQMLRAGKSGIAEIPEQRWSVLDHYSNNPKDPNKSLSKWGGFVDGVAEFDAEFFRISPREAKLMDPQQRILLEMAWCTLEDAVCKPSQLKGKSVGVFIGSCQKDFSELLDSLSLDIDAYVATGTCGSMLSNRLSYFFDFVGPSITVNTACSSSLVALHQAVQALRAGECESALVGGINLCLNPKLFIATSKAGMLSPSGRCAAFSDQANGYVRGEGAAMIYIKPLSAAVENGD